MTRITRLSLQHVKYLPKELSSGILYVSREYRVAGHLCACGCGNKVITPLGPAKWSLSEDDGEASLWPSVGNWQLPCRSHYVIKAGGISWAGQWSDEKIAAGRRSEKRRLEAYYAARKKVWWRRLLVWLRGFFRF